MFEGLSVAMVTPFKNGAIDYTATANLVEFMIEGGVQGLVNAAGPARHAHRPRGRRLRRRLAAVLI